MRNRLLASPVLLLVFGTAFWGGNVVVGRAMINDISPLAISFWRWAIALAILTPFGLREVVRAWPAIRRDWRWLVAQGIVGIGIYNTVVYFGLVHTTAINTTVIYSSAPVMIMGLARVVLGEKLRGLQIVGMCLSFVGVMTLISHGDPAALVALDFNRGDLLIVFACFCWAVFSLLLRRRPAELAPAGLLYVQIVIGALSLLPFYGWEVAVEGRTFALTPGMLLTLLYVGSLPSVASFFFYNRAVQALGAATAGLFLNLIPVFASLMSIAWLGEPPHGYHAVSLALLFAGLYVATRPPASAVASPAKA
ncbi:MAG: EamA family transporter [Alphaproteobacteria bacterium]|nr:EamA family transporter [Alphaproteobacteria bacterium]